MDMRSKRESFEEKEGKTGRRAIVLGILVLIYIYSLLPQEWHPKRFDKSEGKLSFLTPSKIDTANNNADEISNAVEHKIISGMNSNMTHNKNAAEPKDRQSKQIHGASKEEDIITGYNTTLTASPIIVGGIGDSGTRGIYSMLSAIGVNMMPPRWVLTSSKDSLIFMNTERGGWKYVENILHKRLIWEHNPDNIRLIHGPKDYITFQRSRGERTSGVGFLYKLAVWWSGGQRRTGNVANYTQEDLDAHQKGFWSWGVNVTAGILMNHKKVAEYDLLKLKRKNKIGRISLPGFKYYGFKHPRTSLMLPFLNEASIQLFGTREPRLSYYVDFNSTTPSAPTIKELPNWKFIHVIRDGRDNAFAANDKIYKQMCCKLYHLNSDPECNHQFYSQNRPRCEQHTDVEDGADVNTGDWAETVGLKHGYRWHSLRLQFHQDANAQIMEWGVRNLGLMQGYFPLRIEDFVLMKRNDTTCLKMLFEFLELPEPDKEMQSRILNVFAGHQSAYGGRLVSKTDQERRIHGLMHGDANTDESDYYGFELFGYRKDKYGTNVTCEEWIKNIPRLINETFVKNETSGELYSKLSSSKVDWRVRHGYST